MYPSTDLKTGLNQEEVDARLQQYGFNEIPEKSETLWQRILKRLWGPIPWMIEIAAVLSALLQKWEDFGVILLMLLVNVIVDFSQESKALDALKVLKEKLAKRATVLRDGSFKEIEARRLVPGDVVKLQIGEMIPADAVLAAGDYLQIDQSSLTGESLPVTRKTGDEVYGNAVVKMGEMLAIVTKTGMDTYFGKSASLVAQAEKEGKSHFQKAVIQIGNYLISVTAILAVIIMVVSIFRNDPLLDELRFILVLVIASIPVALPAVLSVTMAVGAMKLAKEQAIVSRLASIEELAGVSILCSDKTGTLTQNRMSISELVTYGDSTKNDLLLFAALASKRENQDPIEQPIFEKLKSLNLEKPLSNYQQEKYIPFNPVDKRTEATLVFGDKKMVVSKGAPQVIGQLCSEAEAKQILQDVDEYATKGFRTLAVAVKNKGSRKFKAIGLIPMYDPPREDSADTIRRAKELGLDIKMLTGDNQAIAVQISTMLGIGGNIKETGVLKGQTTPREIMQLGEAIGIALLRQFKPDATAAARKALLKSIDDEIAARIPQEQLDETLLTRHESDIIGIINGANGFSQVLPEDKYMIVDKLQKAGQIVAMTGDGVNDAPALKKADAGIAVSGATDAARAAADLVLLTPGLSVIIKAIVEARMIFERMKGYAIFRIAETTRVILFMTLSILIFNFYPVTAIMIIILALLNDIPIMMIAYDNARSDTRPVRWDMREVLIIASVLGLAGVVSSFLFFWLVEKQGFPEPLIQSMIFVKLNVAGHITIYLTRSGRSHFWRKPYPSMKFFIPAFSTTIVGTLVAVYGIFMTPIGWKFAGYIWAYAIAWFLVSGFVKLAAYKWLDNRTTAQA